MRTHLSAAALLFVSGCIFRFSDNQFNDDKDDDDRTDDPARPDDSDEPVVDDTDETGVDTDDTDDTDDAPVYTCPPSLPLDATVTDGRAAVSRDAASDTLDDMLALLACCVPSDLYAWQGLGHYEVDVQGTTQDGKCAYEILVEVEMGWTTYGCRSEIPVAVPEGLRSNLAADGIGDSPDCVQLGSGGPL